MRLPQIEWILTICLLCVKVTQSIPLFHGLTDHTEEAIDDNIESPSSPPINKFSASDAPDSTPIKLESTSSTSDGIIPDTISDVTLTTNAATSFDYLSTTPISILVTPIPSPDLTTTESKLLPSINTDLSHISDSTSTHSSLTSFTLINLNDESTSELSNNGDYTSSTVKFTKSHTPSPPEESSQPAHVTSSVTNLPSTGHTQTTTMDSHDDTSSTFNERQLDKTPQISSTIQEEPTTTLRTEDTEVEIFKNESVHNSSPSSRLNEEPSNETAEVVATDHDSVTTDDHDDFNVSFSEEGGEITYDTTHLPPLTLAPPRVDEIPKQPDKHPEEATITNLEFFTITPSIVAPTEPPRHNEVTKVTSRPAGQGQGGGLEEFEITTRVPTAPSSHHTESTTTSPPITQPNKANPSIYIIIVAVLIIVLLLLPLLWRSRPCRFSCNNRLGRRLSGTTSTCYRPQSTRLNSNNEGMRVSTLYRTTGMENENFEMESRLHSEADRERVTDGCLKDDVEAIRNKYDALKYE